MIHIFFVPRKAGCLSKLLNVFHKSCMAFETIYLLREVAKSARPATAQIRIPVESLREVIRKLLDEDNIVIYSVARLDDELRTLKELSFLTIDGNAVVIDREVFLSTTRFIERQEELFKNDSYAAAMLKKIKQKAQHVRLLQQE